MFPLFATGINDTSGIGGKFAAGVVDTVVHLDLQISPRIFEKNRNDPNTTIIRGLEEDDSRKKPEAKNLVTLPL